MLIISRPKSTRRNLVICFNFFFSHKRQVFHLFRQANITVRWVWIWKWMQFLKKIFWNRQFSFYENPLKLFSTQSYDNAAAVFMRSSFVSKWSKCFDLHSVRYCSASVLLNMARTRFLNKWILHTQTKGRLACSMVMHVLCYTNPIFFYLASLFLDLLDIWELALLAYFSPVWSMHVLIFVARPRLQLCWFSARPISLISIHWNKFFLFMTFCLSIFFVLISAWTLFGFISSWESGVCHARKWILGLSYRTALLKIKKQSPYIVVRWPGNDSFRGSNACSELPQFGTFLNLALKVKSK